MVTSPIISRDYVLQRQLGSLSAMRYMKQAYHNSKVLRRELLLDIMTGMMASVLYRNISIIIPLNSLIKSVTRAMQHNTILRSSNLEVVLPCPCHSRGDR